MFLPRFDTTTSISLDCFPSSVAIFILVTPLSTAVTSPFSSTTATSSL